MLSFLIVLQLLIGGNPEPYIRYKADQFGLNADKMVCICRKESGFRYTIVGDEGRAVGLWQWHLGSWRAIRKKMGANPTDLRHDPMASTDTALWAMKNGFESWWTVKCR